MENSNSTETRASKHWEAKKVDPRNIIVMPGFNVRKDFGDLEELMESIIENGLRIPLIAKKVTGEDKWELIDGERRYRAIMMALERGHDIQFVKVDPFQGSNEERLLTMATTGMDQKQFSKLEQAEIVARLVKAEYSVEKISKKLSKSLPTVYELLELSKAPESVKNEVDKGTITARTVVQVMKQNPDNEERVIETVKTAVETASKSTEEGKKPRKVTTKNVPGLKVVSTDEKLEELINALKEKGIDNERTQLLRTLVTNLKTLPISDLVLLF